MALCPYYKKCSGCQLQNLSYDRQLQYKQVKAIKLLGKYCHIDEIIGMENPLHYRNKVQSAFGYRKGQIIHGIYQSVNGNIVSVDDCIIEDEIAREIINYVSKLLLSFKMKPYNETTGNGFVRHVLVKRGFASGQIMIVIVTRSGEFKSVRSFTNAVLKKYPNVKTIVQNINDNDIKLSLGTQNNVLYGNGYICEKLCGLTFRISPNAFYQVNPVQTVKLYNKAMEYANLDGTQFVIDAYCGTGTIGMIASKNAKSVIGVELNANAVEDAKANAKLNDIGNIDFVCEDSGNFMVNLANNNKKIDLVITDPPRIGCSRDFLKSLVKLSPKRVVYVSCNPNTLARDLNFLRHNGYKATAITPVDMFPFTEHLECVCKIDKI